MASPPAGNRERSFLSYPNEAHNRPNLSTSVRAEPNSLLLTPYHPDAGERCWIPANTVEGAASSLGSVVLENPYGRTLPGGVNGAGVALQQVGNIREKYLVGLKGIRTAWEQNGKAITVDMARELVERRNQLREDVRSLNYAWGFFASRRDIIVAGSEAAYRERVVIAQENRLAAGQVGRVIEGAVKDSATFTELARVGGRLGKALSVGGTVVSAIEVPYAAYKAYHAQTDKEKEDAIAHLSDATVNAAGAALCIGFGVGTGGLGFLACGVLPVLAGIYADKAARQMMSSLN